MWNIQVLDKQIFYFSFQQQLFQIRQTNFFEENCTDSEEKEEVDEEVEQLLKEQAEKERRIRERKLNIPQIDEAQKIQVQEISSDDRDQRTIFIYNLPFDMQNKEIEAYFQKFGTIIVCEVPKNEGSLVNKGRAFIEYSTVQEAQHVLENALAAQNQQIRGRYIKINQGLTNVVSSLASSTNKLQQFKLEKREKGTKHWSHRHKSKSPSSSSEEKAEKQKKSKKKKHRHSNSRSRSNSPNSNSNKSTEKQSKHKSKQQKHKH